ncbi:hypothetical protein HPB52_013087 [Rhipicephalus sanguineus]|uniref:THAP-type domain-containing protein n=1 Tax=Rhipicephalus sanguineus TaxID=34632 RepID=A0A9D4PPR4_RHISA|nr:hypothetical protein HPB52_013087 [Rhipicephalus sanguineus]
MAELLPNVDIAGKTFNVTRSRTSGMNGDGRADYYTVHGPDAEYVCREMYRSMSALKYLGSGDSRVASVCVSQRSYENLLSELLLVKHYRVEVYRNTAARGSASWTLAIQASPGNLAPLEDVLFGGASGGLSQSKGVLAVSVHTNQQTLGIAYGDAVLQQLTVAEFVDDEHFSNLSCTQRGFRDEDGSKVSRSALARGFVYNRCAADAYLFLQDTDWRKRWIIAIKRDEGPFFTVTKFTKVCSRHFTEANYLPNVAGNRRFLKQDAVPSIFAFSAPRPPPRKKPRNREPLNLVGATEPSEGGRSTTADVSDVDICSPTSVTSSIDGVVCGCACSLKISDLTEQLDVMTARVHALESEVKKKAEEVELTKSSLYKAERALDIAAQERSHLEKHVSRNFSVECFRDSPVYEDVSIEVVWT